REKDVCTPQRALVEPVCFGLSSDERLSGLDLEARKHLRSSVHACDARSAWSRQDTARPPATTSPARVRYGPAVPRDARRAHAVLVPPAARQRDPCSPRRSPSQPCSPHRQHMLTMGSRQHMLTKGGRIHLKLNGGYRSVTSRTA